MIKIVPDVLRLYCFDPWYIIHLIYIVLEVCKKKSDQFDLKSKFNIDLRKRPLNLTKSSY